MLRRFVVAVVLLLAPATVRAQSVAENVWYDVKHAGLDVLHVWTGPLHGTRSDWLMFAVVASGIGAASLLDDDIDELLLRQQQGFLGDMARPFRDAPLVHAGSGHRMMKVLAGVWASGIILEKRALRDAGMGCMASIQANAVVRSVLYKTVSRTRPLVANGNQYTMQFGGGDWDYHSFPGGHGANAHACATFLSDRFDMDWPGIVLHGVAAGVSFGRMVDRRHWLSDALVGMAMGVSMGRTIAIRSRHRAEESAQEKTNGTEPHGLQIVPLDRGGVTVLYTIRF